VANTGSGAWQAANLARDLVVAGWSTVATSGYLTAMNAPGLPVLDEDNTWVSIALPESPQTPGLGFAIVNTRAITTDGLGGVTLIHDLALVAYLTDGVPNPLTGLVDPLTTVSPYDEQAHEAACRAWIDTASLILQSASIGLRNYSARTAGDTTGVYNFDPDESFNIRDAEQNDPNMAPQRYIRIVQGVGKVYQRRTTP